MTGRSGRCRTVGDYPSRLTSGTLLTVISPSRRLGPLLRLVLAGALAAGGLWGASAVGPVPATAAEPNFPSYDSGYHNLPELVAEINQAAIDYPNLVAISSIGKSYQGRDIWIAKVGANVAVDHGYPEVLVDALHHAREHLGTEQALALLRWLTTGYGHDATITGLMNSRVVWIIFALNPDGLRYDLTGSPFRGWRFLRCLLYTSPSPRDRQKSRMPSSA